MTAPVIPLAPALRPNLSRQVTDLAWPDPVTTADVVRLLGLTEYSSVTHVQRAWIRYRFNPDVRPLPQHVERVFWLRYCGRFCTGLLPEILPDPPHEKRSIPRGHVVYFVRAGVNGRIKIGTTSSIARRIEGLNSHNPEPVELLATVRGDRRLEQALHEKFAAYRLHHEWFEPAPELLTYIENLVAKVRRAKERAR